MPIYLAECVPCECSYEILTLSLKDEIDLTCPKCKKKGERRFGVPLLKTNTTFMRGAKYGAEQFATELPHSKDVYLGTAKRAGVSTNGKVYQHGLARFPGDPQAWVSDLDEAKRIIRQRGLASPEMGIKGREVEPTESVAVAEDLIDNEIIRRVESGTMNFRDAAKMREQVADDLAPMAKKGKYKRPTPKRKKR